ncbi:WG repeat-containing protein [Clostridium perfringens]|nr:WG repeat-containing protein [Clostridium perfringens]
MNASVQYLKLNGEPLINDIFERAYPFEDGIAVVVKDNKAGAIDKTGKEVIKFEFDNLSQFENGVSIANLSNNYGIINRKVSLQWSLNIKLFSILYIMTFILQS